jgi:hypothetical protein
MVIMSKTVQIDAAAHGILDVFAHENELESGVATQFRSLQTREVNFRYKEHS